MQTDSPDGVVVHMREELRARGGVTGCGTGVVTELPRESAIGGEWEKDIWVQKMIPIDLV